MSERAMVSVVIPTLGGESVWETIECLNSGTLVPEEILLCIPETETHRVNGRVVPNVTILPTTCRGQVAQRARGFRAARSPLVLQLDDDIMLDRDCLERLVEFLGTETGLAVGPELYDRATGRYRSFLARDPTTKTGVAESILYWVINGPAGYQPGQIGRAGINMGVPQSGDYRGLAWLPGGCVLHRREELELSDFYPFPGKAFAEDLFHSALLTRKGIKLARCGSAKCRVDSASSRATAVVRTSKDYLEYSRRMRVFARQVNGSVGRLYLFLILNVIRLVARKVS
jgi:glycosyltransferase involved in cell wall biosynthesis